MVFIPCRKDCLHIPNTGPDRDPGCGHLYVVLNDTCKNGNNLIVPVCSAHQRCDNTCLLVPGEHKFIRHDNYIAYNLLRIFQSSHIVSQVDAGVISYEGILDEGVFARIYEGVRSSRYSARIYIKYLFG
jgi:hypothetical protein